MRPIIKLASRLRGLILLLCVLGGCYLILFLYSRIAGRWASSFIIPDIPNGHIIAEKQFSENGYVILQQIIEIKKSLATVRGSVGFPMSPIDNQLSASDKYYESLPIDVLSRRSSFPYFLMLFSGFVVNPQSYDQYAFGSSCFSIELYDVDYFKTTQYIENLNLDPQNKNDIQVIAVVKRCWPTW